MKEFIYHSIMVLPSGKLRVKYTKNPKTAEKLGGVLTCRSKTAWHSINQLIPSSPTLNIQHPSTYPSQI